MHRKTRIVLIACLFTAFSSGISSDENPDALFRSALETAQHKLRQALNELPDTTRFPVSTNPDGTWKTAESDDWRSGFFSGCLWKMAAWTKDPFWKIRAERWTAGLEKEKANKGTHDLGFMMFLSFGNGYLLTQNARYKDVLLESAASLASRYNPATGCIKSWDFMGTDRYPVIIDNMMNLELLFWASRNGGRKEYRDICLSHAANTIQNHMRVDGSTFHVVFYDPRKGGVVDRKTHQGFADNSTWARGQAWGLYGFTETYRETKDRRFLETARKMADRFLARLPDDCVAYWDFDAPGIPNEPRDASAAAIAASGLFELSTFVQDPKDRQRYWNAGMNILKSLASPRYLSVNTKTNAILLHATGHKPANREVDVSLIYGDYYFVEALMRYFQWSANR